MCKIVEHERSTWHYVRIFFSLLSCHDIHMPTNSIILFHQSWAILNSLSQLSLIKICIRLWITFSIVPLAISNILRKLLFVINFWPFVVWLLVFKSSIIVVMVILGLSFRDQFSHQIFPHFVTFFKFISLLKYDNLGW